MWKKMCVAAVTGSVEKGTLSIPPVKIGSHPELIGLPALPPGSWHSPTSKEVESILRSHELVVLQHFPTPEFIEWLLENDSSEVFKVYLWCDFEAVPAGGYMSGRQDLMERLLMNWRLKGTQLNRFGEPYVDAYEAFNTPKGDKPHVYNVDVTAIGFVDEYVDELLKCVKPYRDRGLNVGLFFDNVMDQEYFGSATNAPDRNDPERIARWRAAWKAMLQTVSKAGFDVWGNCAHDVWEYPELDGKMDELLFHSIQTPQTAANAAKSSLMSGAKLRHGLEQEYVFHVDTLSGGDQWAIKPKLWEETKTILDPDDNEPVTVVTVRSSKRAFHPGLRVCL